jgi:glutaredoxin-like protein NrdH
MPDTVKLFALSTCGHCKAVKKLLADLSVECDICEVDQLNGEARDKAIELVKQVNPRCTFPTLVIDDQVVVGFHEDEIKRALGQK